MWKQPCSNKEVGHNKKHGPSLATSCIFRTVIFAQHGPVATSDLQGRCEGRAASEMFAQKYCKKNTVKVLTTCHNMLSHFSFIFAVLLYTPYRFLLLNSSHCCFVTSAHISIANFHHHLFSSKPDRSLTMVKWHPLVASGNILFLTHMSFLQTWPGML